MSNIKLLLVLLSLFLVAYPLVVFKASALTQDVVSSAIGTAEKIVASAYEAVLKAEEAGGDVSSLLARLNDSGRLLAAARMSFRNGDIDNAAYFAGLSRSVAEEVKDAALELEDSATSEVTQRIIFTTFASTASVALILLGSASVWHFLKKRDSDGEFQKLN